MRPAPACTMTSCCFASFLTVSGVAATRVSPGRVSAGMPIFMVFSGTVRVGRSAGRAKRASYNSAELPRDALDHAGPVAVALLAEEPHPRIPGVVLAREVVAPVRRERDQ